MAVHVDVVKNEWLAGMQYPVAKVMLDDQGRVTVYDTTDPDRWTDLILRLADADPEQDPRAFLQTLHEQIQGTYIGATEPHDESKCPFGHGPVLLEGTTVHERSPSPASG